MHALSQEKYKIINGLSHIAPEFDSYLLDVWGLLHNGVEAFPGVVDCLTKIKALGKQILLLSNSPRRGSIIAKDLEAFGITADLYNHILTSGDATYIDLQDQAEHLGRNCYFMGHGMHEGLLEDVNLNRVETFDTADFILNCGPKDLHLTLNTFADFFQPALDKDLLMICSNPDMKAIIGENPILCAGTLAKLYEDLGGRVHYHGKPYKFVYELALDILKVKDKSKVLAMGDSLYTDIKGAHGVALKGALVMSGLHGHELGMGFGILPTQKDIQAMALQYNTYADYYLSDLKW